MGDLLHPMDAHIDTSPVQRRIDLSQTQTQTRIDTSPVQRRIDLSSYPIDTRIDLSPPIEGILDLSYPIDRRIDLSPPAEVRVSTGVDRMISMSSFPPEYGSASIPGLSGRYSNGFHIKAEFTEVDVRALAMPETEVCDC